MPKKECKQNAAQLCAANLLEAVGLDKNHPELVETPRRIVDLYKDMTEGLNMDPRDYMKKILPSKHNEMIVIKDIEFVSMCEHHFWPFFGKVHVVYVPQGKIIGLSKFISAVRVLSRRPQLQERMTSELIEAMEECLQPKGSMVVVEGTHTCMLVGGRYDYGFPAVTNAKTVTSAVRGIFLLFEAPRNEAMKLIYG